MARFAHCLALIAWLAVAPARAADMVALVLSETGGAYAEAAQALRAELPRGVSVTESAAAPGDASPRPRIVVAIGTAACAASAATASPVLCTLIPREAFERVTAEPGNRARPLTAVFLDQPPARQMALVRLLLPRARSVGMLFGPASAPMEAAFAAGAARHGLRPEIARVREAEELAASLQGLLELRADTLLAVPDPLVFNAQTVQNILRSAIRARTPVIAFSPSYVRAGALAAVYSTPRQAGRQAGQLVREALAGRALPAPVDPAEFAVSVNPHVAGSLGLDVPESEALAARLRAQERTP